MIDGPNGHLGWKGGRKYCCKKMSIMIEKDGCIYSPVLEGRPWEIHPEWEAWFTDGEQYYPSVEDENIYYCPFCGSKL